MRIGAIVQRYGTRVAGGAERLAREVCTRLAARDPVTVFTTTALDYLTWRNAFAPGVETLDGVEVRRFPVAHERDATEFRARSAALFAGPATLDDELAWIRSQGPDSPALYAAVARSRDDFDAWLVFTYLYSPTVFGLAELGTRAVLVPLAHNEAPLYLRIFKNAFRLPGQLLFQTPEERDLVERVVPRSRVAGEVVGYGVDARAGDGDWPWPRSVPEGQRYALYLGRLDPSKGVGVLVEQFRAFRERRGPALALVLAGEVAMELAEVEGVVRPGFVSEEERERLLAHAEVIVQPSRFESLSIVALEAWSHGRPVLASSGSDVLVGQIERSGGGFVYADGDELAALLDRLLAADAAFARAGGAGQHYVRATCSWDVVIDRYRAALEHVAARPARSGREGGREN